MAFLKLTNISKHVGQTEILSEVSLEFPETGLVFIVGKSGAGKSTLLHIIGQLDSAYEGGVWLDGEACEKDDARMCELRRKKIGFIFQDFNLLGDLSAEENILLAAKLANCGSADAEGLLAAFEIKACRKKPCKVLSGGERQRTAIARAICKESKVILADEPTGNLDEENTRIVFEALKRISRERLVLVVTHDMEAASLYGDRLIRLADGRVISDERKGEASAAFEGQAAAEPSAVKNEPAAARGLFSGLKRQHLKNNRRRNAMIVTLCVFLTALSLITTSLLSAMQSVNSSVSAVLENDKLIVTDSDEEQIYKTLSEDFIRELQKSGVREVVPYRYTTIGVVAESSASSLSYWVFSDDEFFEERFRYYGLTFPEAYDEVVINNALANQVFGSADCIGKELTLYAYLDVAFSCRVAAVSGVMGEKKPAIYLSDKLLEQAFAAGVRSESLSVQTASAQYSAPAVICEWTGEESVIYGREPSQPNEIVVNAGGINSMLEVLELPYAAVSVRDLVEGEVSEELIAAVLDAVVSLQESARESFYSELKIVGITDGTQDRLTVTVNPETYEDMQVGRPNTVDIYLKDRTKNKEEVDRLLERYGYFAEDRGGFRAAMIAARMSVPIVFGGLLAVVSLFLVFLFIRLATKINIMNQVNEIGTLKALGANNRQIRSVYLGENLRLFGWAMLITALLLAGLQIAKLAGCLSYHGIAIFEINPLYSCLVVLVGAATVFAATWLEVRKIAKMNLVDMLRKNT